MAVLQSLSPMAANNSQSSVKYPILSKMTSQKDEKPQLRLISEEELPSSLSHNGGTNSLGQENSMIYEVWVLHFDKSTRTGYILGMGMPSTYLLIFFF